MIGKKIGIYTLELGKTRKKQLVMMCIQVVIFIYRN